MVSALTTRGKPGAPSTAALVVPNPLVYGFAPPRGERAWPARGGSEAA
jgi:hypothetical protein